MNKKTIIFDFDGTIADTFNLAINVIKKISDKYNQKISKKEIAYLIQNKTLTEIIQQFKINKLQLFFLLFEIKREIKKIITTAKPIKDIEFCLEKLKKENYTLIILSSNSKTNITLFLKKHKLDKYFDHIETKGSLFKKDKKLIQIIKKYNLKKNKTIYIGDEVRDLKACNKIKLKSIIVTYGFNSKKLILKYNPKYIASSSKKILQIIKNEN